MIDIDKLSAELNSILEEDIQEYQDIIEEASMNAAKKTVEKLKSTSPKDKGKYAKSWKVEKVKSRLGNTAIVYNTNGQLTHLLEHGHSIANQWGKYGGRVSPRPHIAAAEAYALDEFEDQVAKEIKKRR